MSLNYIDLKMAYFWHDLGRAFCLRAVIMVLGDKKAASLWMPLFLLVREWSINRNGELMDNVESMSVFFELPALNNM